MFIGFSIKLGMTTLGFRNNGNFSLPFQRKLESDLMYRNFNKFYFSELLCDKEKV